MTDVAKYPITLPLADDVSAVPLTEEEVMAAKGVWVGQEAYDGMKAEIERLRQWVADCQSVMYVNCVYCGHRYDPDDEVSTSMADVLKEHIQQCPEHPMSALKAERDDLARALLRIRSLTMRSRGDEEIANISCEAVLSMATYHPTPEETAECTFCLYRDNGAAFQRKDSEGTWSECPKCGGIDETPPYLDAEEIAQEAAEAAKP